MCSSALARSALAYMYMYVVLDNAWIPFYKILSFSLYIILSGSVSVYIDSSQTGEEDGPRHHHHHHSHHSHHHHHPHHKQSPGNQLEVPPQKKNSSSRRPSPAQPTSPAAERGGSSKEPTPGAGSTSLAMDDMVSAYYRRKLDRSKYGKFIIRFGAYKLDYLICIRQSIYFLRKYKQDVYFGHTTVWVWLYDPFFQW